MYQHEKVHALGLLPQLRADRALFRYFLHTSSEKGRGLRVVPAFVARHKVRLVHMPRHTGHPQESSLAKELTLKL